jgi:hypothetical protein
LFFHPLVDNLDDHQSFNLGGNWQAQPESEFRPSIHVWHICPGLTFVGLAFPSELA